MRARHVLEQHPRHLTALIAAVLLGGGGGAFAVASLGPDAASLPVREVLESVEPLPATAFALDAPLVPLRLYRSDAVRPTDTADSLLARLGVSDAQAAAFLRNEPTFRAQLLGRYGRMVTVEANERQEMEKLTARWTLDASGYFKRLVVERRGATGFTTRVETAPLTASARLGSGVIRSSLFAAVDEARIPDEVAIQVADILGNRVDFHRGLRKGDRFSVVYETLEADGEPMRTGRVLSVTFDNNGRTHSALWFQEPGRTKGAYYTLEGKTLQSAYLASPMEFSRVTSGFAMRFHPIMQTWRQHLGVDYGAPAGTPVRVVGDGVVDFAGWQSGYGNVVTVKHNGSDTTLYGHLSRVDVRKGQTVAQGQRLGAVGATGWATGPHLHFEFRVGGVHKDPIEIARKSEGVELTAQARPAFERAAQATRLKLAAAATATLASAQ